MSSIMTAFFCAARARGPAGCAREQPVAAAPSGDGSGTTFEMTPAIGVATGATFVVALGIMAIIACGIACAGS